MDMISQHARVVMHRSLKMIFSQENVSLVMTSKTSMPVRIQNEKKEWVKTGATEDWTEYIFLSDMEEKITFLSKDGQYKIYSGQKGRLSIKVEYSTFQGVGKWKAQFYAFEPVEKKK